MGMDISIKGVKAPTPEFNKKLAAYQAMEAAELPIPAELEEYFGEDGPDEDGVIVDIDDATEGDLMYEDGEVLIDLSKLPEGVTHIKVIASY